MQGVLSSPSLTGLPVSIITLTGGFFGLTVLLIPHPHFRPVATSHLSQGTLRANLIILDKNFGKQLNHIVLRNNKSDKLLQCTASGGKEKKKGILTVT